MLHDSTLLGEAQITIWKYASSSNTKTSCMNHTVHFMHRPNISVLYSSLYMYSNICIHVIQACMTVTRPQISVHHHFEVSILNTVSLMQQTEVGPQPAHARMMCAVCDEVSVSKFLYKNMCWMSRHALDI